MDQPLCLEVGAASAYCGVETVPPSADQPTWAEPLRDLATDRVIGQDSSVEMATIVEVAERAGVGVGTVSRVLNGHPSVAEATRERVQEAMAVLHYRPSPLARNLKRGRTQRIAVMVSFFTSPSAIERLRGLTSALVGTGYELVLYPAEDEEQRRAHMDTLSGPHQADGIVLVSLPLSDSELERLQHAAVSVVQIDAAHPAATSIVIDDVGGGALAARYLLDLGHRSVAFVGDTELNAYGFTSSRDRRIGFVQELTAAGCPPPPRWLRTGTHGAETAGSLARELLATEDRPSAVFAASDTQAFGVLSAARELGIGVPDELSVLGFDDIGAAAHVGLSTIRQPLEESGRLAAELLLGGLADPGSLAPVRHVLRLEVIERSTTGINHR
jgi:DNA-binding LacI/PurR family transcriptional regulator